MPCVVRDVRHEVCMEKSILSNYFMLPAARVTTESIS